MVCATREGAGYPLEICFNYSLMSLIVSLGISTQVRVRYHCHHSHTSWFRLLWHSPVKAKFFELSKGVFMPLYTWRVWRSRRDDGIALAVASGVVIVKGRTVWIDPAECLQPDSNLRSYEAHLRPYKTYLRPYEGWDLSCNKWRVACGEWVIVNGSTCMSLLDDSVYWRPSSRLYSNTDNPSYPSSL
jgi:hypothetical protein